MNIENQGYFVFYSYLLGLTKPNLRPGQTGRRGHNRKACQVWEWTDGQLEEKWPFTGRKFASNVALMLQ